MTLTPIWRSPVFVLCLLFSAVAASAQMPEAEVPEISQGAQAQDEQASALAGGLDAWSPPPLATIGSRRMQFATHATFPSLLTSIEAINFNENTALTGFFQIPPDPMGAVGPAHVVNVVNSSIQWFTKSGVRENHQSLRSFFGDVPVTGTFDPKVVFDPHAQRFVVVTLERVVASGTPVPANSPQHQSKIFVAVSDDADPNGTWYTHMIDSKMVIGTQERWADFPGLAVDEEAIYITNNMFGFNPQGFGGVRLWIIPKASFYAGTGATFAVYDPIALANANPAGEGAVATTAQPALVYDAPAGFGTYLVQYGGLSDGVTLYLGLIEVRNPLAPTFVGHFAPIGAVATYDRLVGFPGAPQLGSTRTIATNDRRVSNTPVMRNNNLYLAAPMLTHPDGSADANQVTVRWFRVDASNTAAPVLADHGAVGGEEIAPGTHTFFPSVAVNCSGDLAVGFAASGPGIHPGAYFTGRQAADAPGTTNSPGTLRAGLDVYVRAFIANPASTATSRWGDYTGTAVDPVDNTFWVFNEYALTQGTIIASIGAHEQGRWGNAWGRFDLDATPPVISGLGTSVTSLWPADHRLVNVAVNYSVTDNSCRPVTCALTVASDEPQNGTGDGDTDVDWVVVDDHNVKLRAERAGNGDGRTYTITATCTDSSSNFASQSTAVSVPLHR